MRYDCHRYVATISTRMYNDQKYSYPSPTQKGAQETGRERGNVFYCPKFDNNLRLNRWIYCGETDKPQRRTGTNPLLPKEVSTRKLESARQARNMINKPRGKNIPFQRRNVYKGLSLKMKSLRFRPHKHKNPFFPRLIFSPAKKKSEKHSAISLAPVNDNHISMTQQ